MSLGIPYVVGPVSEWLAAIVVEGCSPGATIIVQTDEAVPQVLAKGVSSGGRDFVPVVGTLHAKQRLVAFQTLPGDTSPTIPGTLAVIVSTSPKSHAELQPMAFVSKLYHCGGALWLKGAAIGADVSVQAAGTLVGNGRADQAGNARLGLTSKLPGAGAAVVGSQSAPPGFPPLTGAPQLVTNTTLPAPIGKLPTPVVGPPPPIGCESSVRIGGIVDGAEVTIERASDGLRETATFDLDALWFQLSSAFPSAGDKIAVSQAMPRCYEHPSDLDEETVGPARTPDPLDVDKPCAGSALIHVANLHPGAKLTVAVPGRPSYDYVVPPGTTTWDVPVQPLPAHQTVTLTMEICTFTTSTTVDIQDEAPVPAPTMIPELYKCARAVSVNTSPGARLEVWGDSGSGPKQLSPRVFAKTSLRNIGVSPFLTVPEKVWARQISCGGAWVDGPSLDVKPHPRLEPVELTEPLVEGARAVLPKNAIPGAHVTVWASDVNGASPQIIGERDVTRGGPAVGLVRPLTPRDRVWALQEICSEQTREGPHYSVMPGVKVFQLPAPKEQLSQSLNGKAILHTGVLECRFLGGRWSLTVEAEDTDPGYDCGLVIGVDLTLPSPLAFGASIDIDLAAAGGLPQGLASLGYPSKWTNAKYGTSTLLQNPGFWQEVLQASANWKMIAAWQNYAPVGDKPEWPGGPGAPPDPLKIPNDPVDSGAD